MQLCRTESPKGVRYYLDGKRISRERADDLKASHDQDTFVTRVSGDTTRQYSSLRKK